MTKNEQDIAKLMKQMADLNKKEDFVRQAFIAHKAAGRTAADSIRNAQDDWLDWLINKGEL